MKAYWVAGHVDFADVRVGWVGDTDKTGPIG